MRSGLGVILLVLAFSAIAAGKHAANEFIGKNMNALPPADSKLPRLESSVHGSDNIPSKKYGVATRMFNGQGFLFLAELADGSKAILSAGLPQTAKIMDVLELPLMSRHEMFYLMCRSKKTTDMVVAIGPRSDPGAQNLPAKKAWHINLNLLKIQDLEAGDVRCLADGSED